MKAQVSEKRPRGQYFFCLSVRRSPLDHVRSCIADGTGGEDSTRNSFDMFRTTVTGAAKRDLFCASQDSLRRMMDACCSFGLFLTACFATTNPAVAVVLVVGGCGSGGGSLVRLFVCSFFHVFVCAGYCVLCLCVFASLRRVVPCCVVVFVFGVFVVVCCVSLSVRVRCEILGRVEKRTIAKAFANDVVIDINGGDRR